jgi:1-phosphatidylinositol-3-phosphate 5-kinase
MFEQFGPTYFDYMVKAFFHNYPCTLSKILGAFVVKVKTTSNPSTTQKRYILVQENLNLGITSADEKHIVRYDLKGSESNRFV